MEQIIKNIFNDPELASQVLETAKELKEKNLILKGGTSCLVGNKYLYTFIFEDSSYIASIELMDKEEQLQFRIRQNNRASQLYEFLYYIMDEFPGDIKLSDITNNIITITCTIS